MVCLRSNVKPQVPKGGIAMLDQYVIVPCVAQAVVSRRTKECEPRELSHRLGMHLLRFLEPLVYELDATVDKRPLRTPVQTVGAIVALRNANHSLFLSDSVHSRSR